MSIDIIFCIFDYVAGKLLLQYSPDNPLMELDMNSDDLKHVNIVLREVENNIGMILFERDSKYFVLKVLCEWFIQNQLSKIIVLEDVQVNV